MECRPVKVGDMVGFVCGPRPRKTKCGTPGCGKPTAALCDYPVTRKGQPTTCSAKLCEDCRVKKDVETDLCPPHARLDAAATSPRDPRRGDCRTHVATGVDLWVLSVDDDPQGGDRLVTFGRSRPDDHGRCAGVLQTVPLAKWREKTKAPPLSRSACRGCSKVVEWRKTAEGKSVPVDPDPHADGNLVIDDDGVVLYGQRGSHPSMYLSHFATCPNAERFRRPKPKARP